MNLQTIAEQITKHRSPGQTIVLGIDGLGGAGKSTISEQLCEIFRKNEMHVTLLHIDDFIHPKAIRYNASGNAIIICNGGMTICCVR